MTRYTTTECLCVLYIICNDLDISFQNSVKWNIVSITSSVLLSLFLFLLFCFCRFVIRVARKNSYFFNQSGININFLSCPFECSQNSRMEQTQFKIFYDVNSEINKKKWINKIVSNECYVVCICIIVAAAAVCVWYLDLVLWTRRTLNKIYNSNPANLFAVAVLFLDKNMFVIAP